MAAGAMLQIFKTVVTKMITTFIDNSRKEISCYLRENKDHIQDMTTALNMAQNYEEAHKRNHESLNIMNVDSRLIPTDPVDRVHHITSQIEELQGQLQAAHQDTQVNVV